MVVGERFACSAVEDGMTKRHYVLGLLSQMHAIVAQDATTAKTMARMVLHPLHYAMLLYIHHACYTHTYHVRKHMTKPITLLTVLTS